MMTMREARQRCSMHNMGLSRRDREFRVFFPELHATKQEASAYYTDDIEDAVLTAASMRRQKAG